MDADISDKYQFIGLFENPETKARSMKFIHEGTIESARARICANFVEFSDMINGLRQSIPEKGLLMHAEYEGNRKILLIMPMTIALAAAKPLIKQ